MNKINDFPLVLKILEDSYKESDAPSVTLIAQTKKNPFHVLISTLISLRTKDEVTLRVSRSLYETVENFQDILNHTPEELSQKLYPAGFYKTKALNMIRIAEIVRDQFGGKIPDTMEYLLSLPGVGRKTANLVLIMGFNKPGLCVDTHVHRITNRFGWVKTKTPDDTEMALRKFLPEEYWRIINDYLVSYGQTICKPISPWCSQCRLNPFCPRNGVEKFR
jgi:endonuclease-3